MVATELLVLAGMVSVLAVLYGIALTGDHPMLSSVLRGVSAEPTDHARPAGTRLNAIPQVGLTPRTLVALVGIAVAVFAAYVSVVG